MSAARRSHAPPELGVARAWRRLRWLYLVVLGAIGAVLTLGERLSALLQSKAWMYVYVVVDLFKIEIVAAVVLLLIWDVARARSGAWRPSLLVWIVILGIGAFVVYEGRFYVAGKRIYLREYPLRLVLRAEHAFAQSDRILADAHLAACREVLRSAFCEKKRQQLHTRVERAQRLRNYLQEVPGELPVPIEILETIFLLDRDRLLYEREAQRVQKIQANLTKRYGDAIGLIAAGQIGAARTAMGEIQRVWQGFGDCHLIARELAALEAHAGVDASRIPYVAAVQRYGPEDFVRRTLKLDRLRTPEAVLREGPRRLMFMGAYLE